MWSLTIDMYQDDNRMILIFWGIVIYLLSTPNAYSCNVRNVCVFACYEASYPLSSYCTTTKIDAAAQRSWAILFSCRPHTWLWIKIFEIQETFIFPILTVCKQSGGWLLVYAMWPLLIVLREEKMTHKGWFTEQCPEDNVNACMKVFKCRLNPPSCTIPTPAPFVSPPPAHTTHTRELHCVSNSHGCHEGCFSYLITGAIVIYSFGGRA